MNVVHLKTRRLLWFIFVFACCILLVICLGSSMGMSKTYAVHDFKMELEELDGDVKLIDQDTDNSYRQKLKATATTEYKYEGLYNSLTEEEIANLTEHHNHDVSLYWSKVGPLHRMLLPLSRPLFDKGCLKHVSKPYTELESVSIVICHKNELVYSLLRALTAINERTPKNALNEVLIIDDGSDKDDSAEVLEYSQQLGMPIKTLRHTKSVGIAKCRYSGILESKSKVIVILDSHMEVSDLWLEPLLDILHSKPRSLAVPLVHMINEYLYPTSANHAVRPYAYEFLFGYSIMHWCRGGPPQNNRAQPFSSASLGGGAIAAYKSTLLELYPINTITKGYLWGIENNRLALRAWLCGDGVWIAACSQVSHLNGPDLGLSRYGRGGWYAMKNVLERESVAEILNFIEKDEEKAKLLDRTFSTNSHNQEIYNMTHIIAKEFDHGTLCTKNYSWYLQHIHTSMHYRYFDSPDFLFTGEVQSTDGKHCLCSKFLSPDGIFAEPLCRKMKPTVFWDTHLFGFARNGAVYTSNPDILCWDVAKSGDGIRINQYGCHSRSLTDAVSSSQVFLYNETSLQIQHLSSRRCVELDTTRTTVQVYLMTCNRNESQKWIINKLNLN